MTDDNSRPALLIVDDDPLITDAFTYLLEREFKVVATDTRAAAIRCVRAMDAPPPVALVDLGLPPKPHRPDEGFALIGELLAHAPGMRIIVLSGQSEVAHARHARALGALEYLAKPVDPQRLRALLHSALELAGGDAPATDAGAGFELVGDSEAIRSLRAQIEQYADAPFPVLVEGESGTGKELVVRGLHRGSTRRNQPCLTLNCAAIAPALIESLLFGHARGAFTGATTSRSGYFEEAGDGTLFLDEIGDLPLELQPKLLRVLEDGEFHRVGETHPRYSKARIIAATNRDLKSEIRAGRFRADLYHRLSVFSIALPPLRALGSDRSLLLDHFRARFAAQSCAAPFALEPDARRRWMEYDFPGNVRELRNIAIRLQTKHAGQTVGLGALEAELDLVTPGLPAERSADEAPASDPVARAMQDLRDDPAFDLDAVLRNWERHYIEAALRLAQGRMSQTARLLGIHRSTLYSRMDALGMSRPQSPPEGL